MTRWSIRFSDGSHGPLVAHEEALRAFDRIDPVRRELCALTCWEQIEDTATAETLRPSAPVEPPCRRCGRSRSEHSGCGGYCAPLEELCICGQPADPRWFLNGKPACDGCGEVVKVPRSELPTLSEEP
jgi:hypothetical protein